METVTNETTEAMGLPQTSRSTDRTLTPDDYSTWLSAFDWLTEELAENGLDRFRDVYHLAELDNMGVFRVPRAEVGDEPSGVLLIDEPVGENGEGRYAYGIYVAEDVPADDAEYMILLWLAWIFVRDDSPLDAPVLLRNRVMGLIARSMQRPPVQAPIERHTPAFTHYPQAAHEYYAQCAGAKVRDALAQHEWDRCPDLDDVASALGIRILEHGPNSDMHRYHMERGERTWSIAHPRGARVEGPHIEISPELTDAEYVEALRWHLPYLVLCTVSKRVGPAMPTELRRRTLDAITRVLEEFAS